jgi:hypothetical protein
LAPADWRHPVAAGVDGLETDLVAWQSGAGENLTHLFFAEDDGQFLFRRRAHDAEDGPITIERVLLEKADATDGNGHRGAGVMFAVLEMEEVLAQFFFAD